MTTVRDKIDQEADAALEEVWRLKQLKAHLEAECPTLLDLEVDGYLAITATVGWDGTIGGNVYVSGENLAPELGVRLLDLSLLDHIEKGESYAHDMRAEFPVTARVGVSMVRPAATKPCRKFEVVRKVKPTVIEVCGEVDESRYEVIREVLDEVTG